MPKGDPSPKAKLRNHSVSRRVKAWSWQDGKESNRRGHLTAASSERSYWSVRLAVRNDYSLAENVGDGHSGVRELVYERRLELAFHEMGDDE